MAAFKRVVVIGLDGLEPKIVERMVEAGDLPHFAKLRGEGAYSRIATTLPAQTPVAWSTFATGVNPGGHGIYDFITRDPASYLPDLSLNRYEQKSAFLPPKAVNRRGGVPVWSLLAQAGISSTVLRCPCTYPPDDLKGRMLSGMGVPDLRGGLGTSTFYTSDPEVTAGESEVVVHHSGGESFTTHLIGPRNPKTGQDVVCEIRVTADADQGQVRIQSSGQPKDLVIRRGVWSDWLTVKFKVSMLQSVTGCVRFYFNDLTPHVALYASPINFDPSQPMFPISAPWDYASELARKQGMFYTTGMVEDHAGLNNGRFDEAAFLAQCDEVFNQREAMMCYELDRHREGLFYCLYDTPDRLQHMFWRFREVDHPAHPSQGAGQWRETIEDSYRRCDKIVGRALEYVDNETLFLVLSDHGFNSFQRGFCINTWLYRNGLLALKPGVELGDDAGDFLRFVDWGNTKAYALGLGSIYLNLKGREAEGTVGEGDAMRLRSEIAKGLTGVVDEDRRTVAVRSASIRDDVYAGPRVGDAPDLVCRFAEGYRASWGTALGGIAAGMFEDNCHRWSGDHIIDPTLVPGICFSNRKLGLESVRLLDMAPTILDALGVPKGSDMEGTSVLR